MGKKCIVCGAPIHDDGKCEYCGEHIGKSSIHRQFEPTLSTSKNWVLISIYIVGMVVLPAIIAAFIALARGYSIEYFQGDGFVNVLSLTNFIAYAILCFVMILLTFKVFKVDFQKIDSWGKFFLQMLVGVFCTFGAAMVGNMIVMLLGTTDVAMNQELIESAIVAMPILMIITVVIFAPIVEEIIFRLVLMNLIKWKVFVPQEYDSEFTRKLKKIFSWRPIYSLILSSLVFGLIHVLIGGLIHIIPYFLMGLVFGFFYLRNNNIWHVTILHIIHNGLTVLLMLLLQM